MKLKTIETERLILKEIMPQDAEIIFNRMTQVEIMELFGHRTEEEYRKEVKKYKSGYTGHNRIFKLFIMCEKSSNRVVGRCGFHNWNLDHNRAEIGYEMIDDTAKRKGLMSEAVSAIIQHGFLKMQLHRIEALVVTDNMASIKIIQKNNFKQEGIMRGAVKGEKDYEDCFLFSILKTEYKEV